MPQTPTAVTAHCNSEGRNLKSCWYSTVTQNSFPALQLCSIQSTSLNEWENLTELTVICTIAGQWGEPNRQPRCLIHPDSSAPTTNGRNQCTEIRHHERSKFGTWKFANLEKAAAWSAPAPNPVFGAGYWTVSRWHFTCVTLSLDIDEKGILY